MSAIRDKINELYPIRQAYYLSLGRQAPTGKCFCPFHDNTNTPAAKVYQKVMVCFGECNRSYDSYDFLSKFRSDIVEKVASESMIDLHPHQHQEDKTEYPDFHASSAQELIEKWQQLEVANVDNQV